MRKRTRFLALVCLVALVTPLEQMLAEEPAADVESVRMAVQDLMDSFPDRFTRGMVGTFNHYAHWYKQMHCRFADAPQTWTSWREIGRDIPNVDRLGTPYVEVDPVEFARWRRIST